MKLEKRLKAFADLGKILRDFVQGSFNGADKGMLEKIVDKASYENPWFVKEHILYAFRSIGEMLHEAELKKWIKKYPELTEGRFNARRVGVVMAGNIPAVGFHDFLCVLMSGHHFAGKLSSQDQVILPGLAGILTDLEPGFKDSISFTEGILENFDAIIATGSDNSARYFEYYFGRYPSIIRKNRNGIAVLNGNENDEDLSRLAKDIFLYFGLGCRNVSKLYVPQNYDFDKLVKNFRKYEYVIDNHKYRNNYDYFKSIYMINQEEYHDNGFVLLKEDRRIASPVSVLLFEKYNDTESVNSIIEERKEEIQCIVSKLKDIKNKKIEFGQSQDPGISDYADDIDTMRFLNFLN